MTKRTDFMEITEGPRGPSILEDLPDVYDSIFPDFFRGKVPQESLATCNNCAMVCRDKEQDINKLAMRPFQEDKKCCTYHPSLPSYLVGGALASGSPEGIKRLQNAINKKIGVTPFGLMKPNLYNVLYKNQSNGFGNSERLLCPYFLKESGNCSVWKFRESVCSTFFCKHIGGPSGKKFWAGLKSYLSHAEQSLAEYLAKEADLNYFLTTNMGFQNPKLTVRDLDELPPNDYEKIWGDWNGREEEYYKWAFQKVNEMSRGTFEEISGVRQKVILKNLEIRRGEMLDLPKYLKIHLDWMPKAGEQNKVIRYKTIDIQFPLPSEVLTAFDGKKSVVDVTKNLLEKDGIEIEGSLILSLYHYGILEKCG